MDLIYEPFHGDDLRLSRRIAFLRRMKNVTTNEVADHLCINEDIYIRMEHGDLPLTFDWVQQVSLYLGIEPVELLDSDMNNSEDNKIKYVAFQENSTFQAYAASDEGHWQNVLDMLKLTVEQNKLILEILDKKRF